jgi:general secretion pathway protein M
MMNVLSRLSEIMASTAAHRWYAEKSTNDQLVLKILFLLTSGLIFMLGIWQPITEFEARERSRASEGQVLFEWIALNRSSLLEASKRQTSNGQSAAPSGPTIAQITNTAAEFNVVLSRLQPESDGTVSVSVEQQSFNQLITWLATLEQKQNYVVERGSIDQGSEQGLVNAQFRFR